MYYKKDLNASDPRGLAKSSSGAYGNVDRAYRRRGPQLLPSGRLFQQAETAPYGALTESS